MNWIQAAVITASILAFQTICGQIHLNDTSTLAISSVSATGTAVNDKMNELQSKLKLGLTKEEVQALFTEQFEIAYNSDSENGSDSYWKYEYFKVPGYDRTDDLPAHADHVIDYDALVNKQIGAYLYMEWKNNKLILYSIAYVNPKDHEVQLYVMGHDGTASDRPVSP
ncbi:hypothetical protein [Paenibacillus pedocola]|uniref:hypothetical protein n=1 Tax=Paenibacillus pedocola TaxID=3242193 RepID=UPI0028775EC5|nr:hypothetical protein [Paenibacillus typhae]